MSHSVLLPKEIHWCTDPSHPNSSYNVFVGGLSQIRTSSGCVWMSRDRAPIDFPCSGPSLPFTSFSAEVYDWLLALTLEVCFKQLDLLLDRVSVVFACFGGKELIAGMWRGLSFRFANKTLGWKRSQSKDSLFALPRRERFLTLRSRCLLLERWDLEKKTLQA